MHGGVKTFILIITIPLILAVSHDIYFNYFSSSEKMNQVSSMNVDPDKFEMSELGWVWLEYSKDSHNMLKDSVSDETWAKYIRPLMNMKTIIVAAAPIPVVFFLLLSAWVIGIWPFAHVHKAKKPKLDTVYTNAKTKKQSYNRK